MPKRDDLIQTALDLFCSHGFHAVGIDRIIEEASVAKATLYKHFPSKDALILAALECMDEDAFSHVVMEVLAAGESPREQFLALPRIAAKEAGNGCVFVLAAQEFPDAKHPAHKQAAAHKRRMRKLYSDLARAAGASDPAQVGGAAQLVLDGLYAACVVGGRSRADAIQGAESLLDLMLAQPQADTF